MEPWIPTLTGSAFDLANPSAASVHLVDIVHALSCINRYTGQFPFPLSVAQHSVLLSQVCPAEYRLEVLLHDVHEAYTGDVSAPLKTLLGPTLKEIEAKVQKVVIDAIAAQYNVTFKFDECAHIIKDLDTRIRHSEKRLFVTCDRDWNIPGSPLDVNIEKWNWRYAQTMFNNALTEELRNRSTLSS
jgi:hypothetical protein